MSTENGTLEFDHQTIENNSVNNTNTVTANFLSQESRPRIIECSINSPILLQTDTNRHMLQEISIIISRKFTTQSLLQ